MNDQDTSEIAAPLPQPRSAIRRFLIDLVETVLLAVVIFVGLRVLVRNFWIEGSSMEPSLHDGQYLLVVRFAYWLHPPRRGDIIVFSSPSTRDRDLIKRVVGLPGEQIEIKGGRVWVDGKPLEEPYAPPIDYSDGRWTVGEEQVFVLGDNRNASQDSHRWGSLDMDRIIGKAWLCYWPPSSWGTIPHHHFE